jgi:hypothetical protein
MKPVQAETLVAEKMKKTFAEDSGSTGRKVGESVEGGN